MFLFYKWIAPHIICGWLLFLNIRCVGVIHIVMCNCAPFHLHYYIAFHYRYSVICLSILLYVDIGLFPIWTYQWIVRLCTFLYLCFSEHEYSLLLVVGLGIELLTSVYIYTISLNRYHQFSKVVIPIYNPQQSMIGQLASYSCHHVLFICLHFSYSGG